MDVKHYLIIYSNVKSRRICIKKVNRDHFDFMFPNFDQVILISSVNEPLSRGLLEKVSQQAGCGLRIAEQQKGFDVERLMKEKKLRWDEVAFMGECHVQNPAKPVLSRSITSYALQIVSKQL